MRCTVTGWLLVGLGLAAIGCSDPQAGDDDDDDGDWCVEPGSPTEWVDGQGTWFTSAVWDVSGRLSTDPLGGLGGAMAGGMATRLAPLVAADVPGTLEDEIPGAIAAALVEPIAEFVHGALPEHYRPDSATIAALHVAFGAAAVETTLVIAPSGRHTETLTLMTLPDGDTVYDVPLDQIDRGEGAVSLSEHPRTIQVGSVSIYADFNDIVVVVADEMLGVDLSGPQTHVDAAVDCPAIVATLSSGTDDVPFELDGETYNLNAAEVAGACEAVKAEQRDYVLGYLRPRGFFLYGCLDKFDDDGDLVADRLVSRQYYEGSGENIPISLTATR